jgi:uncharacterized protein YjdB
MVTGKFEGKAIVTVTTLEEGKSASCEITVESVAVPVSGVTLNKNTLNINKDGVEKLTSTVSPADATVKGVKWTSSNPDIAKADQNGNITGVGGGSAVITVSAENGGFTASCAVTVNVPVTGVSLEHNKIIIKGGSVTLDYTVIPADATNKAVTWKSSNNAVAAVDAGGTVTAKSSGSADITVTTVDGSKTDTCAVTVVVPVSGVSLSQTTFTLAKGGTATLIATVLPADATNKAVTWSSSNNAVATVDANGNVTGKSEGSAVITVTTVDGGKAASCAVTVIVAYAVFNVSNEDGWKSALSSISSAPGGSTGQPNVFVINITGSFSVDGIISNSIGGDYKEVRLTGSETVSLSSNGSLIRAAANQTFIIDGPTLQGKDGNNNSLVYIGDGAVELQNGEIIGNTVSNGNGGGVYVGGGIFTMTGGKISGNAASSNGGGVFIVNNGNFTMTGGKISGNTVSSSGGGVHVSYNGNFMMNNGEISGNTAADGIGGGVYVYYGNFTMSNGKICSNTASLGDGGGVCVDYVGNFTMSNGEISSNHAGNLGGGVYIIGNFTMTDGVIYGNNADPASLKNTAALGGAAVYNISGNNKDTTIYKYP